jgi:ABC-type antimicrobial peptide transport system, permease component
VGETIDVEGVRLVIVGVAPKGFTALGIAKEPDVTVPLTTFPLIAEGQTRLLTSRTSFWVGATGRLRDGIPFNQAQAELETLWPAIKQATLPPDYSGRQRDDFLAVRLAVTSGARGSEWSLRSRFEEPLRVLWMLALVTFLVACVNLATLMLSRAAAGCHEMAIRGALGASRWRIVAPVVAESLLITVVGTAAGWVLGLWSTAVLSTAVLRNYVVPTVLNTRPNAVTLCVASGAAAAAVVVLSLPGA